ncbi:hypothetical protein [Halorarum salinum]|uniref:Uncharacterized protein n=1 Tax=Halorarum salinum TaxID=2743089 RepID=A0A7D5QBV7_9EURY|nr:hypothetical protein [Halobaculum salinum]QLG63716.1 hypothetical protein HUG12_19090 [Halobaculum salinum]
MNPRVPLLLVALALLVGLAGCSAAGSIDMTPASDAELADHASRSLPTSDDPRAAVRRDLVRGAVRNGSATANDTRPPVDPDGLPFAVDGAYHDLSVEETGNHTETRVSLEVDYNGTTDGEAVAHDDLPPADRALVDAVLPPRDGYRTEEYDLGTGTLYTDEEAAESVLLGGGYDAVEYDGERYPIRVEDGGPRTVTRYRYTATEVAPSAEAYGGDLRETKAFTLSGLPDAEAEIVGEAVDGSYYAESDDDEAFASLLDRFRSHEAVESDEYAGSWIVRYEGEIYWARLHYEEFPMERR